MSTKNKILTFKEIETNALNCRLLLLKHNSKFISKTTAKKIYKLSSARFDIFEVRLKDNLTEVVMRKSYAGDDDNYEKPFRFFVQGKLGKKLNMC